MAMPVSGKKSAPAAAPASRAPGSNGAIPTITSGPIDRAQRAVLYGPAGIGKTSLAALLDKSVFLDLEDGTDHFDVKRMKAGNYLDTRAALHSSAIDGLRTLILDTFTTLQGFALDHVLTTIRNESGNACTSIEDYGWGKGYRHVYDAMNLILADLDRIIEKGINVCVLAHVEATQAPNPQGADWLRWEPMLQHQRNANLRNRLIQWADHVLVMGYHVNVSKDGKGQGGDVRMLYPTETPTQLAKSRTVRDPIVVTEGDASIWEGIIT